MSNKDTPFDIIQVPNGLFTVVMLKGGTPPALCDGFYTSRQDAEKDLILYLKQNDRLGYAKYPGKGS